MTDAEWEIIKPLLPPAKTGGRPRTTKLREVFNAIQYMAGSGCQWRMLPSDFPPVSTVQGYFYYWTYTGLLETIIAFWFSIPVNWRAAKPVQRPE